MKRFITYLYLYENNEKKYNTGFAKMEIRNEQTRVELHIKAPLFYDTKSVVYLFAREEDFIHAVEIGQIVFQKGIGEARIVLENVMIGKSPYGIGDMKGILIVNRDESRFISQWDEEAINVNRIRIVQDGESIKQSAPLQSAPLQAAPAQAVEESTQAPVQPEQQEPPEPIKQSEPQAAPEPIKQPEPTLHTAEIPMPRIIHGNFPREATLAEHYDKVWKAAMEDRRITGSDLKGVKIELQNIKELPKQYWNLGNNSFLLHGFFNYRYLVLGKRKIQDREVLFMGIPGVYQNQERVMATIFGFPEFVVAEPEQRGKTGEQFGYWCHIMDE